MPRIQGIDISSHQHDHGPIDFSLAAHWLFERTTEPGVKPFVIVKATEGVGYINPHFLADCNGFKAFGINVMAYLFDHGKDDPTAEQGFYSSVATGLPEMLDFETPDGMPPSDYGKHAEDLAKIASHAFVYLDRDELEHWPGAPWGHRLVLADPGVLQPHVPCSIWQYGQETVPGIVGTVDADEWYGGTADYLTVFPAPLPPPDLPPGPSPTVPVFPGVVRIGAKGPVVVTIQQRLNHYGAHLKADGDFGPLTFGGVKFFQKTHSLVVDGIVGPKTWAALWLF
jgi:hypothetical protein